MPILNDADYIIAPTPDAPGLPRAVSGTGQDGRVQTISVVVAEEDSTHRRQGSPP